MHTQKLQLSLFLLSAKIETALARKKKKKKLRLFPQILKTTYVYNVWYFDSADELLPPTSSFFKP